MNHQRLLELATDVEYRGLFSKTRSQIRQQFGLPPAPIENDDERDYMGTLALETLAKIEQRAAALLLKGRLGTNPADFIPSFQSRFRYTFRRARSLARQQGIDLLTGEPRKKVTA